MCSRNGFGAVIVLTILQFVVCTKAEWPIPADYVPCKDYEIAYDKNVDLNQITGTWYMVAATASKNKETTLDATQAAIAAYGGCWEVKVSLGVNINVDFRTLYIPTPANQTLPGVLNIKNGLPPTYGHWVLPLFNHFQLGSGIDSDFFKINSYRDDLLIWVSCTGPLAPQHVDWGVWSRSKKLLSAAEKTAVGSSVKLAGVITANDDVLYNYSVDLC